MTVVYLTALRRGGLRPGRLWVERAFPDRQWVIAAVQVDEDGQRRVVIEPAGDSSREASYAESYFRRHFMDRTEWLRRENERVLRKAKRKEPSELLREMARINASRGSAA